MCFVKFQKVSESCINVSEMFQKVSEGFHKVSEKVQTSFGMVSRVSEQSLREEI